MVILPKNFFTSLCSSSMLMDKSYSMTLHHKFSYLHYSTNEKGISLTLLCTYLIQKPSYIVNFVMYYQPSGFSIIVFFHFC